MRAAMCVTVVMIVGGAAAARGQAYPGYPAPTGGVDPEMQRQREPRRSPPPVYSAELREGPPAPDFFQSYVDLTADQLGRYTQLRDSFMTATQPQRDSLTAVHAALQRAFQDRDRVTVRLTLPMLRRLGDALNGRLEQFDKRLKKLLTKDQWKTYRDWQDQQRRAAEEEQRARMPMEDS